MELKEVYIKGPVLVPGSIGRPELGQTDRPLTPQEIQKAAYTFLPGSPLIDLEHNFEKQAEIVESYITPEKTVFNNKEYPTGTWFVTSRVENPLLIQKIQENDLNGFSVGAIPDTVKDLVSKSTQFKCAFKDVGEGEWTPIAVSMVKSPYYPESIFKVFQANEFIKKSLKKEEKDEMTDNKIDNNVLNRLLNFILKNEDSKTEEETGNKSETESVQESLKKIFEKLESIEERIKALENKEKDEEEPEEKEESDKNINKSLNPPSKKHRTQKI